MMRREEALHTAARRYCMERSRLWSERYAVQRAARGSLPDPYYTPEEYAVFTRYNVLDAILVGVERVTPRDYRTVEELRAFLVLAGQTAESDFTRPPNNEIAARTMAEERSLFCDYIERLSEPELLGVAPLPYRRSLTPDENTRLWSALDRHWGTGSGYWHPLGAEEMPPNVIAFQAAWFDEEVPTEVLRGLLAGRGVQRLWELREHGPEYEIELALFEPYYNGAEGYWTAGQMDWLIYASHESSITVAGDWLIESLKASWPNWHQRLYTGWDYEPPG